MCSVRNFDLKRITSGRKSVTSLFKYEACVKMIPEIRGLTVLTVLQYNVVGAVNVI